MTLEAVLASFHLVAVLMLVVFLSSQAALCRTEWMNAAVVQRLARLSVVVAVVLLLVFATGMVRVMWCIKGASWYGTQPLFHIKTTLFLVVSCMALRPWLLFRQWKAQNLATGRLPDAMQVHAARRWVMAAAHMVPVIAVLAVFWARGW